MGEIIITKINNSCYSSDTTTKAKIIPASVLLDIPINNNNNNNNNNSNNNNNNKNNKVPTRSVSAPKDRRKTVVIVDPDKNNNNNINSNKEKEKASTTTTTTTTGKRVSAKFTNIQQIKTSLLNVCLAGPNNGCYYYCCFEF